MISAKDYFRHFIADDVIRQLNHDLVNEILKYKPRAVFEFGAGQGKNLELILNEMDAGYYYFPTPKVFGIDISPKAIEQAYEKGREYVTTADENALKQFPNRLTDISFTCSVLDHIEHEITVDHILTDLKRISKKAVILLETERHTPSSFYYYHPYEEYGFKKLNNYQYLSTESDGGDGSMYYIWKWERDKK